MADLIKIPVRVTGIAGPEELDRFLNLEVLPLLREITTRWNAANGPVVLVTASETVNGESTVYLADATADNIEITLPAADLWKSPLTMVKTDSGANTVKFVIDTSANADDTINGGTSITLSSQYQRATVVSDEQNAWFITAD